MKQLGGEGVMISIVLVVAGVTVIAYVLVARWRGQVLNVRRLLVLPGVLAVSARSRWSVRRATDTGRWIRS